MLLAFYMKGVMPNLMEVVKRQRCMSDDCTIIGLIGTVLYSTCGLTDAFQAFDGWDIDVDGKQEPKSRKLACNPVYLLSSLAIYS